MESVHPAYGVSRLQSCQPLEEFGLLSSCRVGSGPAQVLTEHLTVGLRLSGPGRSTSGQVRQGFPAYRHRRADRVAESLSVNGAVVTVAAEDPVTGRRYPPGATGLHPVGAGEPRLDPAADTDDVGIVERSTYCL
jgi:hypothetical protein